MGSSKTLTRKEIYLITDRSIKLTEVRTWADSRDSNTQLTFFIENTKFAGGKQLSFFSQSLSSVRVSWHVRSFRVESLVRVRRVVDDLQLPVAVEEAVAALDEAVAVALLVTELTVVAAEEI